MGRADEMRQAIENSKEVTALNPVELRISHALCLRQFEEWG
jgi:hypothetical protein